MKEIFTISQYPVQRVQLYEIISKINLLILKQYEKILQVQN